MILYSVILLPYMSINSLSREIAAILDRSPAGAGMMSPRRNADRSGRARRCPCEPGHTPEVRWKGPRTPYLAFGNPMKYLQGSCVMLSTTTWGPSARRFCSGSGPRRPCFTGRSPSRGMVLLAGVLAPLLLAGCGTLENGRGWGQDALWPVDLERVARAGRDALLSPATWVPLAGAGVFSLGDLDDRVSDWASEHNPLFGSQNGAEDASNYLSDVLHVEALGTLLATPSGDPPRDWALAKLKGGAVELGAIAATRGLTDVLKDASDRERPDGSDDRSFPSGHTSHAFAFATLANRNLESLDFLEGVRTPLQIGNAVLASGVGWARVEARKHHPSDVLFGAALGHFVTAFIHDAFLNLPEDDRDRRDDHVALAFFSTVNGAGLALCFRF